MPMPSRPSACVDLPISEKFIITFHSLPPQTLLLKARERERTFHSCVSLSKTSLAKMAGAATSLFRLARSQATHFSSSNFRSGFHQATYGTLSHAHVKAACSYGRESAAIQKRWSSKSTSAEEDNKISIGPQKGNDDSGKGEKDAGVVYYGPISSTIKKVKLLSLSTCCLSVSLGPVITFMTSPDMNVILKGAVASSVIFLSATTTGALHWFVSPYVHKLRWQPGSDCFEVEMMSWLATLIPRTIQFADIRPPETNRPFVTFKANRNFYFVDAEHCHNKALLAKLTPKGASHGSALKNL